MVRWIATIRSRTWRAAAAIAADRAGGIAVMTALSLSSLVGAAGLGTEAGLWYVAKRDMQSAADTAAYSASSALMAGQNTTNAALAAKAVTARYGFANGTGGVVVTVNSPPESGSYTTNSSAVEVIVQQPQTLLFSSLFLASSPTISARAVGLAGVAGNGCVLTLDKGNVTDLTDSGGATLNLNNCGIDVNSSSADALSISGGATINAYSATITGNYETSGGAKLSATHGITTGAAPTADPYVSVNVPSYSGCNQNSYSLSGGATKTLSAGGSTYVFCNGLSVSGGATLTLGAGVYIIDRGSFSLSGGAIVNATSGTTIVLTSSTGAGYATAQISGGTTLSLTAPSTGATAGLAFFQDRNAPSSGTNSFSGGSTQKITGAIYFPNQGVSYSGGATTGGAACTQLVAFTAQFSGGTTFNNTCSGVGVNAIGGSSSKLVE
jgi:Flp pilus assembly protein TadG